MNDDSGRLDFLFVRALRGASSPHERLRGLDAFAMTICVGATHRAPRTRHTASRTGMISARCVRSHRRSSVVNATPIARDELDRAARARGLTLTCDWIGPAFKIRAVRSSGGVGGSGMVEQGGGDESDADVVATHEGFIAPPPFGILHMDSMRVYNSKVASGERATMRSTFGIAILLGTMSLLFASEAGCKKCELLAIDDGNGYAEKLVRYYGRLGFETVRVVGDNGLRDLPDLLVWGGVGTRMNGDVDALLEKWGNVIRKSLEK